MTDVPTSNHIVLGRHCSRCFHVCLDDWKFCPMCGNTERYGDRFRCYAPPQPGAQPERSTVETTDHQLPPHDYTHPDWHGNGVTKFWTEASLRAYAAVAARSPVETKELSPSEAASFDKALARSPRRVPLRDSDAAFNLGVVPTEQPEKATEIDNSCTHEFRPFDSTGRLICIYCGALNGKGEHA